MDDPRTMSSRPGANDAEWDLLHREIARMRASVMALVFGLTGGTGIFLATVWLLLRGGEVVGPHLGLLANYFPGYSVTWPGAVLGFAYGALSGAVFGGAGAWIYNLVAGRRR